MLAAVTTALAEMKVSILQVNCTSRADGTALNSMKVSCKNTEHYNSIVSRLKTLPGVIEVVRGFAT
jgi:(p)ppGpp synthase/HD superfamily hydrolase